MYFNLGTSECYQYDAAYIERKDHWNPFIHGEWLFQKYMGATWAKIQQNTMNYYVKNQKTFRADSYESIKKARENNKDLNKLGKKLNILIQITRDNARYVPNYTLRSSTKYNIARYNN